MAKKAKASTLEASDAALDKVTNKSMDLVSEIDRNLKIARRANSKWRKEAQEDIEFAQGDQWSSDDKTKLADEGRPCLTFNKIKPLLGLVSGHFLQNDSRIQVAPEGGEDRAFSNAMDVIVGHVSKQSKLDWNRRFLFEGGEKAGQSYLGFFMNFDSDPIFGELKSEYLGPFTVFMDPNGVEYDHSDCEYGFVVRKISKGALKEMFPKMEDEIDDINYDADAEAADEFGEEGDANNYGADKGKSDAGLLESAGTDEAIGDSKRLTTVAYWHKKRVNKWFVYDTESGSLRSFEEEDKADKYIKEQKELLGANKKPDVKIVKIKKLATQMWVTTKIGTLIVEDKKSWAEPYYSGFTFFQYCPELCPDISWKPELMRQGMVRPLKDPQREINKARSQFLHILNTSANSGWIGDEDALQPQQWTDLETYGSKPGLVLQIKKGARLERISPVEPSLAAQVREKAASDNIKEVSGLNADMLSVDESANPSGRAIALRIRQAITILEPHFQAFRFTQANIGEFIFKVVPMLYDTARLAKILGEQYLQSNGLDKNKLMAYMTIIEDGRYNVKIAEQGFTKTMREETFENLMTMIEKRYPIPPDVLIEYMNFPNKEEVVQKIQAYEQKQQAAALAMEQAKHGPPPGAPAPTAGGANNAALAAGGGF